eukprot:scaffold1541_cov256-Pinguiococcus_pyrenoidosus.AAC.27
MGREQLKGFLVWAGVSRGLESWSAGGLRHLRRNQMLIEISWKVYWVINDPGCKPVSSLLGPGVEPSPLDIGRVAGAAAL